MHLTCETLGIQANRKCVLPSKTLSCIIEMILETAKTDMNPIMKSRSKLKASESYGQTHFSRDVPMEVFYHPYSE